MIEARLGNMTVLGASRCAVSAGTFPAFLLPPSARPIAQRLRAERAAQP